MFGKNYDKEIDKIIEVNNSTVKYVNTISESIKTLREFFTTMQNDMIDMAKIQAQHKAMLSFLIKHASVDAEAEDDLHKMMQEIIKYEKEVKQSLKEKK